MSRATEMAGPRASKSETFAEIITAPYRVPSQPLITAPSEAANSRSSENKVPVAQRKKPDEPPTTISIDARSMNEGRSVETANALIPQKTRTPSHAFIFIFFTPIFLSLCVYSLSSYCLELCFFAFIKT